MLKRPVHSCYSARGRDGCKTLRRDAKQCFTARLSLPEATKNPCRRLQKMPEEIEVPTEHLHEQIHEAAEGHHHLSGFNMQVALSTALLAVLAAIAALFAGHAANEALLDQIKASDQWSYYQSKSIKENVLSTKLALIVAMGKTIEGGDVKKLAEYKTDLEEIKKEADAKEAESASHMKHHVTLARSVTLFQIAIALSAIAVLTKKRPLWLLSLALGAIGGFFFVGGLL
jgi:hypothetical protein